MPKELKQGDTVNAIFRRYGNHHITGIVNEVSHNQHGLDGYWVSIKVKEFKDKQDSFYHTFKNLVDTGTYNVLCPIADVWKDGDVQ